MAERAGIFEEDLDLSGFAPKKVARVEPAPEAIREVSEKVNFQSREPAPKPAKRPDRRHRTGRSEQLNLKVRAEARELFYRLNDAQGWVQGAGGTSTAEGTRRRRPDNYLARDQEFQRLITMNLQR